MAAKQPTNNSDSEEIDLGQLFQLIGRFFQNIFNAFLRFFLFLKRNALIIIGLAILGAAIGIGLKQFAADKMKTEVIVRPNIESKNYLYDVVAEIQGNVRAKSTDFFKPLGVDIESLAGFEVAIEPIGNKKNKLEEELQYLELIKGLDISSAVSDVVRDEILNRNSLKHKITFFFKEGTDGHQSAQKLMEYINSNSYFNELIAVYMENAKSRIEKNTTFIAQIDELIIQYSKNLADDQFPSGDNRIILDGEGEMDVRGLFDLKNNLIQDIESKKLELKTRENAIKVINFGQPQEVRIPFFGKTLVLLPLLLVGGFFIWAILKYLNSKAQELT